jgi:hypothetical protein
MGLLFHKWWHFSVFRQLGASLQTIEVETRKLEELKAIVFQDFRREMVNKLKKQSESRVSES